MLKRMLTFGLVILLTLAVAGTAMAADPFMETGTVVSIGADSFEFDVDGTLYTVLPPMGFDLTTLTVGDVVEVTGEVDIDVVTATSIVEVVPMPFLETGAVASIGVDSFELDVAGTLYTVLPPMGFDLTTLTVGEIVEVEGEVFLGVVTATSIVQTGLMAFSETGTVASVGVDSFELDVAGTLYTVLPPMGFDLTTLIVGDTVEVEGTIDSSGVVTATSIVFVTEEEVEYIRDGFYCENPDAVHPVIMGIANRFETTYEEVLGYFCGTEELGPYGLGEIMLAYMTSLKLDDGTTAADLLGQKTEMGGWGKVWHAAGLIGKPEHAGPPEGAGKPEDAGPPEGAGKPEDAGKPDDAGPPDHAGKPDDAGPPAGRP